MATTLARRPLRSQLVSHTLDRGRIPLATDSAPYELGHLLPSSFGDKVVRQTVNPQPDQQYNADWNSDGNPLTASLGINDPWTGGIYLRQSEFAAPDDQSDTLGHEAGHTLWSALPDDQQMQWEHIHKHFTNVLSQPNLPAALYTTVPRAVRMYTSDPAHSFAEIFGQYAHEPEELASQHPTVYNWLKSVVGREYRTNMLPEQNVPTAAVPLGGNLK